MECWLKSSREEQGRGQQAAETDNNQVPGTSPAIISRSHVQPPASPPPQAQTLRGQRCWTWPYGPRENVHLVWGVIWDLFSSRPRLRQNYASLSSSPLCSHDTVHQHPSLLTPSQCYNQYLQMTTLFSQTHLHCTEQKKNKFLKSSGRIYKNDDTFFKC